MTPSETGEVFVDQVLHGYREGHRRLAGSVALDEASQSTMLLMSDLLTDSLSGPTDSYLCGYPVRGSHLYVLARTWLALELPRPGCVWTHSLVFDYGALARISSLSGILRSFKRPSLDDFGSYDRRIASTQVSDGPYATNDPPVSKGHQFLPDMRWAQAAQYLYTTNRPSLVLRSKTSEEDEALAVALWEQMWPRLRRSFLFCSRVSGSLKGVPSECSLLFSEDAIDEFADGAGPPTSDPAFHALFADLVSRKPTELRRFLWRYTVDIHDQRQSALPLCSIYLDLTDRHPPVASAVKKIRRHFADSEQARLLKTDVLLGRNYTSIDVAYAGFAKMLEEFSAEKTFVQADVVSSQVREFDKRGKLNVSEILNAVVSSESGSLGELAIQSVTDTIPLERIAEADLSIESKVRVARLDRRILLHLRFWPLTARERLQIWDSVTVPSDDLGATIAVCGPMLEGKEVEQLIRRYGKVALRPLVRLLQGGNAPALYSVLAQFPQDLVEAIEAELPISSAVLDRLAEEIDGSNNSAAIKWSDWLSIIRTLPGTVSNADGGYSIATITFKCALRAPEPAGTTLFSLSFDKLHAAAALSRLPTMVRRNLELALPAPATVPPWDFCGKLRSAVLSRYVRGSYIDASLMQVSRDQGIWSLLLMDLADQPNGRSLLQSLQFEVYADNGHRYTSAQAQAIHDAIEKLDERRAWWKIF